MLIKCANGNVKSLVASLNSPPIRLYFRESNDPVIFYNKIM